MVKYPEPEYYFVKIFHKIPIPFFTWPALILFFYLIASNNIILGFGHKIDFEYIRFYLGNTFFSIIAIVFIVIIYEKNIREINKWVEENDISVQKSDVVNKLNTIHKYFFGWNQFLITVSGVLVRKGIIYFLKLQNDYTLGKVIIDTITIFLIISLLLTALGVILCVYTTGSNGIKAKYPFEVQNAYKDLVSLSRRNAVMIGIYLALYCSSVFGWAYQHEQIVLGVIIDVLILISIFIAFIIEIAGIKNGIAESKKIMLSEIKREMGKVQPLYTSLIDSMNKDLPIPNKFNEIDLILENLSNKGKSIGEINEWMIDVESVIKIGSTLIATIIIPVAGIIPKIASYFRLN
ncbi:MAG: hypothetical protein J5U17_00045 [Candidatus Methanoperedens sp.]|nr:hypothetical protein [Candidatus Methanoperedens sp.]MCE8428291.1 hypothetical protein [Candidatus Methanoperedens sp.]